MHATIVSAWRRTAIGAVCVGIVASGCERYGDTGDRDWVTVGDADDWARTWTLYSGVCGLKRSGELQCWGIGLPVTTILDEYSAHADAIECSWDYCCALADGALTCEMWKDETPTEAGLDLLSQRVVEGPFSMFALNAAGWCVLTHAGVATCGDDYVSEQSTSTDASVPPLIHVATASGLACGVDEAGAVWCWSPSYGVFVDDDRGYRVVAHNEPPGVYRSVGVGGGFACALDAASKPTCWTLLPPSYGQNAPPVPDGTVQAMSVGLSHACYLDAVGGVSCRASPDAWFAPVEYYYNGEIASRDTEHLKPPREMRFTQVSAGDDTSCGVRDDGHIVCWGYLWADR
jgi:hypothetical protein